MAEQLHLLTYDYVPDVAERRTPYRDGHLAAIARFHAAGDAVIAGALGDPPRNGLFAFRSPEAADRFVAEDPYVEAGLVVSHRIDPWTVVTPL